MKKLYPLCLLALIITQYACKEKTFLDQEALPLVDGINVFQEDTFTVISSNLLRDSVFTSEVNLLGIGECSQYPYLGGIVMDAGLQFRLPKEQFVLDGDNPQIDSVIVSLPYAEVYMDTVNGGTEQKFNLYEITTPLDPYYRYLNTDQVPHNTTLLNADASKTYDFRDYLDSVVIWDDTLRPQIRIKLSDDFVAEMQTAKDQHFNSTEDFIQWFPGLFIKSERMGANSYAFINVLAANMTVYYHNDSDDSLRAVFPYDPGSNEHFTEIHRSYDPQILASTQNPNPQGEDWTYMGFTTGIRTKIEIPYNPTLDDYIINDAILEFTAEKSANSFPVLNFVFPRLIGDTSLDPTEDFLFSVNSYSGYILGEKEDITLPSGTEAYRYKLRITQELTRTQKEKSTLVLDLGGREYDDLKQTLPMCTKITKVGGNNRNDDYKLKLKILYSKK